MNFLEKYILLLSILMVFRLGMAQKVPFTQGLSIGMDAYQGTLLIHRPEQMTFALPNPVRTYTLEVMKQTFGKDYWSAVHGHPRFGWVIFAHQFGNPEVLGNAYGFHPNLDAYILRRGNFSWFARLGYGLAWVTKPYDRVTNPENLAIGSKLNNITTIGMAIEYRIAQHWQLRLGGNITHISNGKVQAPNLGLNTATLRLGVSYEVEELAEYHTFDFEKVPRYKKWVANVRFGLGMREDKIGGGPKYPIYIFSVFGSKMVSRKSKFIAGFEAAYNLSTQSYVLNHDITDNPDWAFKPWRYSAFVGHEFMFGRIGFMTHAFFYLDPPFKEKNSFGFKLGPNVYLYRPHIRHRFNAFFGIYMKSHFAVAEYPEMTVGVSF